ncbi:MAG: DUF169 domain-containing protein [Dehalococcoidales bacterium]|nr:DUF169 domain-containing protein [Dehalococcoidales bacterium]
MKPMQTDFSVYRKFNFQYPPVAIKFLFFKPDAVEPLEKKLALCEMIKEAQLREKPFFMTGEDENCFGKSFLGMTGDGPSFSDGGELGILFGIFREPRDNIRLRRFDYSIDKGVINYVVFSKLDQLNFEPDILFILADTGQTEIILRAMTYSTGEMYESKLTTIGGCSWLFAYPYLSGKVNFTTTGLSFGMKSRKVFPEGRMLISIPYQWIPTITRNLEEMEWVLPSFTMCTDDFLKYEKNLIKDLLMRVKEA